MEIDFDDMNVVQKTCYICLVVCLAFIIIGGIIILFLLGFLAYYAVISVALHAIMGKPLSSQEPTQRPNVIENPLSFLGGLGGLRHGRYKYDKLREPYARSTAPGEHDQTIHTVQATQDETTTEHLGLLTRDDVSTRPMFVHFVNTSIERVKAERRKARLDSDYRFDGRVTTMWNESAGVISSGDGSNRISLASSLASVGANITLAL